MHKNYVDCTESYKNASWKSSNLSSSCKSNENSVFCINLTWKSQELTQANIHKRWHNTPWFCIQDGTLDTDTHNGGLDASTSSPQNGKSHNVLINTEQQSYFISSCVWPAQKADAQTNPVKHNKGKSTPACYASKYASKHVLSSKNNQLLIWHSSSELEQMCFHQSCEYSQSSAWSQQSSE